MSEDEPEAGKKKGGKKPLILGLVGALILGGGGGFAAYSGLVPVPGLSSGKPAAAGDGHGEAHGDSHGGDKHHAEKGKTAYVPLEQITVPIGQAGRAGRLRLSLTIETTTTHASTIEERSTRMLDTLNSFLRAVEENDLRDPSNMERLRAQMLRRVMLEAPPGAVSDLLVAEFLII